MLGLWLAWSLCLAAWLFVTPGYFKLSRAERAQLDDELVRHHRNLAIRVGFAVFALAAGAAAVMASAGQVLSWWPVAELSAALIATAGTFAVLDLRANA